MAIEKTVFTAGTIAELYNWLSVNAADYFDSITNDTENNKVVCTIDNVDVLKLSFNSASSTLYEITPLQAESALTQYSRSGKLDTAWKTSKGILLMYNSLGFIFICKNKNGETCVVAAGPSSSSGAQYLLQVYDLFNSTGAMQITSGSSSEFITSISKKGANLSLAPVITNAGNVLDGVYVAYWSPLTASMTGGVEVSVNDVHYAFTGTVAVSD